MPTFPSEILHTSCMYFFEVISHSPNLHCCYCTCTVCVASPVEVLCSIVTGCMHDSKFVAKLENSVTQNT